jgi:tetratricopeptide (TPR) repeat protein
MNKLIYTLLILFFFNIQANAFWERKSKKGAYKAPADTSQQVQSANKLLDNANALYQNGRYAQAILMYRKAEERGADPVATNFNIANSLFRLEKLSEAAAAYRKSADFSKGEFAPALFNLAAVLYRLLQYSESIAVYHRALRIDEENISAWLYLAEAYKKTGDLVGALRALENAARLDSEDISVVYQLAEIYVSLNEFDVAVVLVREAYIRNPGESDFLIYIGDVYRLNKDYEASAGAYREALALQPDNVNLLYKLADVLAEDKKSFLAMDILNQTLQIKPSFSDAAIFLGNLAFEAKWWDRAEQAYTLAGQHGNNEAIQGLRNLAYEFEQRQQIQRAIAYLEKALELTPGDLSLRAEIERYGEELCLRKQFR